MAETRKPPPESDFDTPAPEQVRPLVEVPVPLASRPASVPGTAAELWTPHEIRVLAAAAAVDPRTAAKWLADKPVTSTCAARLMEARRRLGAGDGGRP